MTDQIKARVQLLGGGSLDYLSDADSKALREFISEFLSKTGSTGVVISLDQNQDPKYQAVKEIFVDQVLQP
jgi:hypothetical protein